MTTHAVKDVSDFVATFTDKAEAAERLSILAECAEEWIPEQLETEVKSSGLQIISAAELLAKEFSNAEDIVVGILPQQSRLILSAPAKLGKSRFLTGLLLGIATGRNVMGFTIPKARRVLCLQSEVSEHNLQKRLQKILTGLP